MAKITLRECNPPAMGANGSHGASGGRPSKWSEALDPLREVPGVWHVVEGHFAPSTASYIARGLASGIEAGDFEATTRTALDGEHAPAGKVFVFVRFTGGEEYPDVVEPELHVDGPYRGLKASAWKTSGAGVLYEVMQVTPTGHRLGLGFVEWDRAWRYQGHDVPPVEEPSIEELPVEHRRGSF